jgi:VCBS repeat-containing protein
MVESSWHQRLRSAFSRFMISPHRRPRPDSSYSIEALESRVVLTNHIPTATSQVVVTLEDQPLNGQLQAADQDPGDVLTYHQGALAPTHGVVTVNSDGTFTYTPDINFNGNDSFSFFVNDGTANSEQATINVTVTAVNDAPTVINGSATPNEDLAFPGTVATLAFDADTDNLTFAVVTQPTHGTLTFNANGTFTYTPVANYNGLDSFTFRANDGQVNSNVGTFNLSITPVDDPLALTFPSAKTQIGRNSAPVRIDPASTVKDIDTVVNYGKTEIRTTITAGNTNGDAQNNRVALTLLSQGNGLGLVNVKGSKIYYNGNATVPIGTVTGGDLGHALVIKFSDAATEDAVNAVLRQISIKASKKAFVGDRTINVVLSAGGQKVVGTKSVAIV